MSAVVCRDYYGYGGIFGRCHIVDDGIAIQHIVVWDVSIAVEYIPAEDFVLNRIEFLVESVGQDDVRFRCECIQVVDYLPIVVCIVFDGRFVDDHIVSVVPDHSHDIEDAGLSEVVGARFHDEAIYADSCFLLAGFLLHGIGYESLSYVIAFNDGLDEAVGNRGVVGKELFGIFG